jgi:hypothetical protein
MKKLLTLLVLVCMLSCSEDDGYKVKQKIEAHVKMGDEFLIYQTMEEVLATRVVHDHETVKAWYDSSHNITPELIVKRKQQADSFANILNQLSK